MSEMSTESVDCVLCENAESASQHGKGGFFYKWIGDGRRFPEDVESVAIVMPISWHPAPDIRGIQMEWSVSHKNKWNAQWLLSGTLEKPTLSPSLNWVNTWHGHLTNGRLESC